MARINPSPNATAKFPAKNIGIMGCGAIGSRMAKSVSNELAGVCRLTGLFDTNPGKVDQIAKALSAPDAICRSFDELLTKCDILVEATTSADVLTFIRRALQARKHVLVLSVGKLLQADDIFSLARENGCSLMVPSGAIAGIDAVKSASLVPINKIVLTTRKPINGFEGNVYIQSQGIDLSTIRGEVTIFDGDVDKAVQYFPQNINVAATLALAARAKEKIRIRIVTSPAFTANSHEIEMTGDFGRMVTRTENVICPDNPKTSYLAVLSGIQTLKEFCSGVRIGT